MSDRAWPSKHKQPACPKTGGLLRNDGCANWPGPEAPFQKRLVAARDVVRCGAQLIGGGATEEAHGGDGDDADKGDEEYVLDEGGSLFLTDKATGKALD